MFRFGQQEPVQFPFFTPFTKLCKFLSHKQKFLSCVSHHKCISGFQIRIFIKSKSRHLIQHRTLEMYHLIMRQYQNIILTVCITHGKCHQMMVILSEIWIQFHIFCEVMHPSHIPLQTESQSTFFYISGNLRPCRRFLCDHKCSRISSKYNRIQMSEEIDCLQVLILAIFVCNPFSVLPSVIQIQHRSNRIHTQSVYMELLNPE